MKALFRMLKILHVIARYRLDTLIPVQLLPRRIRPLIYLMPWRYMIRAKKNRAVRFRLALESLGPVFIKFGQILSTRRDLLPDDIALELAKLQDQVPPFESALAVSIIEKALGESVLDAFSEFNANPLASASIAQVHEAKLLSGEEVVVKVIRPNIEHTIHKDMVMLKTIAAWIDKLPDGKRLRPLEVVEDYKQTVFDELDLMREAANCATLRRNFKDSELLYIPEIYWDYCRTNIMVMEKIEGYAVGDIKALKACGIDMKLLAERGVEIFFTQVFRDSFFHADMHPGNIFVSKQHPENPQYIGIDFGIIGSLSPEDLNYLAQNLYAFFNRDYRKVAQLHVDSGWVPKETKVHEFESAIRTVLEPIFEKPLAEISFGQVLIRLFQTARRFDMQVQPQLVLLQKTLLNTEGLGRQLYPELDLWQTAKPFIANWIKQQVGPKRLFHEIKQNGPSWLEKAPHIPDMLYKVLENQIKHSPSDVHQSIIKINEENQFRLKRNKRVIITVGLVVIGILFHEQFIQIQMLSSKLLANISFSGAAVMWLTTIFKK
ncbi:ubiquinone biosynthesis regulatory protein kinase UbiB [Marinicellulosiphila megalodicopiae]|uniref:ubiquinone biosynthesis regulatory protein kinase UbiB n=1 Tax=Marinicellulosiphila megalodicopiae TaxID=2724896 RepID=UPI003BB1AC1F